jgi:Fur family iron response transcriptional regulator
MGPLWQSRTLVWQPRRWGKPAPRRFYQGCCSRRSVAYNDFTCNNLAGPGGAVGKAMTQSFSSRPPLPGTPGPTFQLPIPSGRSTDRTGCPWHDVKEKLRDVGLRPTRQRMALGWILFAKGDRHVTAEMLYEEATRAKVPVSLATVYNTLHQFTEVGLLRQVAVDGSKAYFDTNNSEHHHFFIEDQNDLMDIPSTDVVVGKAPVAPEGYEIARIDVVVRLRRKK